MIKFKTFFKSFFLTLFIGASVIIVGFYKPSSALALGNPPTLNLPYSSGTTGVSLGASGLHAGNFYAVPGTPYTLNGSSSVTDASLDIGFVNQSSTSVNAIALASGTVLIGYGNQCNMVLIDYGDAGNGYHLWGEYVHMGNIPSSLTAGSNVSQGQTVGIPTTNYVCGESGTSNFVHTHFAFLYGSGTSGTYQSQVNSTTVLCGKTVLSNASAPNHGGTVDNIQGLTSAFTIPSCPASNPSSLMVNSGVTITSPTSHPVIMNEPMTASFTVTNPGSSSFNLQSLGLFGVDPNGNSFLVYGQNFSSVNPNGGQATLNANTGNFAWNCSNCTYGGTYKLYAEYLDTNSIWHILSVSGGTNPLTINVGKPANITVTNGITVTTVTPGIMRGGMNATYTVTNSGDEPFNLQQLFLSSNDPNGTVFDLGGDAGQNGSNNSIAAGGTRTLTYSNSNFANGCTTCKDGTWTLQAKWEDGTNNYRNINSGSGYGSITTGIVTGHAAIAVNGSGVVSLFARGNDNDIYQNYKLSSTGSWSGWGKFNSVNGLQFKGDPVVAINQDGRLEVFARGPDGYLWHISQKLASDGGGWTNWTSIPSTIIGDVSVIKNASGVLEVFERSSDNSIYHIYQHSPGGCYNGTNNDPGTCWNGWYQMSSNSFSGDPIAILNQNGVTSVFAKGSDKDIYQNYSLSSGNWSGWGKISSTHSFNSDPIAIKNADGRLEVFSEGSDGNIWHIAQKLASDGGGWTNWATLSSSIVGKPMISINSSGQLELFARGTNLNYFQQYETTTGGCYNGANNDPGSCWSGWGLVTAPNNLPMISTLVDGQNSTGQEDLFGIGTDGAIYESLAKTPAQGGGWNNWTSLGSNWK